ncbi:MAG: efflux RND transporter periplasmic adaptor subunit [Candidatus Brocadiaceae bacterium]|nr:efflux RND transporter periplasmic adaptor subunit [Candidatus Brocadiaceae bacterium]
MKRYTIIGILSVSAIVIACIVLFGKNETIKYETVRIDRGFIEKYVTATGTVNPVRTVIIGSQVSGLITELFADYNSVVKVGQIVARIDPVPFELQVKKAKASLATAIATLEKAEANAKNNKRKYRRAKQLFAKKVISVDEYDEIRTKYDAGEADVKLAEAEKLQAEVALEIAKTDLEHTVIVSPLNGIVVSREVDVGQTVASSFQTPTLFTIAEDLVHMQVHTNVDEADIGVVRVGQEAKFTVDAFPDDFFKGKVTEIRIAPILFQNVVTYDTLISVDNSSLKLKPGMTANTSILVARAEDVLRVSNAALRYIPSREAEIKSPGKKPSEEKSGGKSEWNKIWILENGILKKVSVKLGIGDYNFTEILEGDVREGLEVVISETLPKSIEKGSKKVPWSGSRSKRRG